jgi:carbon storage regulator CsrA
MMRLLFEVCREGFAVFSAKLSPTRLRDDVAVTILSVNGTRVRVGIDAPRAKSVHRWEIYQRIRSQRPARGYR